MTDTTTTTTDNQYNEYSPEHCLCESSYCEHTNTTNTNCPRTPSQHVWCEYIIEICDTCAATMCRAGGSSYIHLIQNQTFRPSSQSPLDPHDTT